MAGSYRAPETAKNGTWLYRGRDDDRKRRRGGKVRQSSVLFRIKLWKRIGLFWESRRLLVYFYLGWRNVWITVDQKQIGTQFIKLVKFKELFELSHYISVWVTPLVTMSPRNCPLSPFRSPPPFPSSRFKRIVSTRNSSPLPHQLTKWTLVPSFARLSAPDCKYIVLFFKSLWLWTWLLFASPAGCQYLLNDNSPLFPRRLAVSALWPVSLTVDSHLSYTVWCTRDGGSH